MAAISVLVFAGCTSPPADQAQPDPAAKILAAHGLDGLTAIELIDFLDRTPVSERSADLRASVRPTEVLLSDSANAEPVALAIPGDNFYLSVAPYVNSTHECYFHSLTTCLGELGGEEVQLTVIDTSTGETLVDKTATVFDNGFVAVWLPRDIEATLRIEYDGLVAESPIATGPEDPTCVTTMQLA